MDTIRQTQREMPFMSAVETPHVASHEFISRSTWVGVLRYCTQRTGLDDYEIADAIGISHGYMAKILKGTGNPSGNLLLKFQRFTRCVAPTQWQAYHMGADLVMRDPAKARIEELERELQELKRYA